MNVSDFTYLLNEPENISREQIDDLGQIIKEYPYFQAARAIYLKGLKNLNSFKYNDALKKTAVHTTDRHILFEFITSEVFEQHKIAQSILGTDEEKIEEIVLEEPISKEKGNVSISKVKIADDHPLPRNKKDAEEILNPHLFTPKDPEMAAFLANRKAEEEKLQMGEPLSFRKAELHSFSEWLKLSSLKPIDRESTGEEKTKKKQKFELIDRFIETNPKIVPSRELKPAMDLSDQGNTMKNALMTETLARVYLEQKKYAEAIQAFKILSLKYPEKSGFFADQIRAVKKLQQNN